MSIIDYKKEQYNVTTTTRTCNGNGTENGWNDIKGINLKKSNLFCTIWWPSQVNHVRLRNI